ncbi:PEGA domain-containing protein [Parendozoicomonas haliclonae]|uniref:PEGA domain protein n=1 Tax=Parendozoicomonas haliclonae TaxID=1960125 RepID=A0A1X7API2_9GAMM|nr:PEGA domain-containing protein [Parendozoicomonas haliclonae]SMA50196.1 PEGA domain protein [Parendozoicomonas haliclonae]
MEKLSCINSACNSALGGVVKFCPFCGHAQQQKKAAEKVAAAAVDADAGKKQEPEKSQPKKSEPTGNVKRASRDKTKSEQEKPKSSPAPEAKKNTSGKSMSAIQKQKNLTQSVLANTTPDKSAVAYMLSGKKAEKKGFFAGLMKWLTRLFYLVLILVGLGIALVVFVVMTDDKKSDSDSRQTSKGSQTTTAPKSSSKPSVVQKIPLHIYTSPSDAKVRIMNIGPKYKKGMLLEPGNYKVEVSRSGYKTQTKTVKLTKVENNFRFTLEKSGFSVNVQKLPANGYVVNAAGTKRLSLPMELPAGKAEFILRAPGHYDQRKSINVDRNGYLEASLKPIQCSVLKKDSSFMSKEIEVTFDLGPIAKERVAKRIFDYWEKSANSKTRIQRGAFQLVSKETLKGRDSYLEETVKIYEVSGSTRMDLHGVSKTGITNHKGFDLNAGIKMICAMMKEV